MKDAIDIPSETQAVAVREPWNRCDVCGKFISLHDFNQGWAIRKMVTPDSAFTAEVYETLCREHRSR